MRRGLRPHRAYTKRSRPIRRLSVVVLALAAAGALAVTGMALAAGSSIAVLSFSPNNPHGVVTSGRLYLGTRTNYTAATTTKRIQLNLDDDFQFNPNSFPKCNPADISGDMTMQEAMPECGPPAGAANNAWLYPTSLSHSSNGAAMFNLLAESPTACVLVFNGAGATSEVLLFIRVQLEGAAPSTAEARRPTPTATQAFL